MVGKRIRDGDDVSQTAMDKSQAVIGDEFRQSPKTRSLTSNNDDKRHCVSGCSTPSSDDMVKASHAAQEVDDRNIGKTNIQVEATGDIGNLKI